MDPKSLFRESALKNISSPEQLDQLIRVISVKAWLFTISIYLLLIAFIIWLVVGSVATHAEGPGILLAGGGSIYSAGVPAGPSRVDEILIKSGNHVSKGQVLATLSRPDLSNQITVAKQFIIDLNNKYAELKTLSTQAITQHHQDLQQQRQVLADNLVNDQVKLKNSLALLTIKQDAYKTGLQTRQNVDDSLQAYYSAKNQVQGYKDKISQLEIDEANFNDQWNERLRQLSLTISDAKNKLHDLQARKQMSTHVFSPVAGTVINIQATVGNVLNVGAPLITIASDGQGLDALVFLPPQLGKRIKQNMEALVTPTTVEKAEYGSIYGKVISVAAFPTSADTIQSSLQNPELVKTFTDKQVPIIIRIQLQADSSTVSGLKWTSANGPNQLITAGNIVNARITIRKQPPITLIIPTLKKMMGVE